MSPFRSPSPGWPLLPLPPVDLAWVLLGTTVASLIRAFAGFGFALAGVPLVAMALAPAQAVPVILAVEIVSMAWVTGELGPDLDRDMLRALTPPALVATPFGVWMLASIPADTMRIAIAVVVLAAAVLIARRTALPSTGPRTQTAVGLVSGLMGGATGMAGPPVVLWLLARDVPPASARATMLAYFAILAVWGVMGAAWHGLFGVRELVVTLWCVPLSWVAHQAGRRAFWVAAPETWRKAAIGVLVAAAVGAIARALP